MAALLRQFCELGRGCPPVLRLGLATRGDTRLDAGDVAHAVTRGVNYLNWCGYDDGMARAVREGLVDRESLVVAMQLQSRDAVRTGHELQESLSTLGSNWIDVVTFYYVEEEREWEEITAPGGAWEAVEAARKEGKVRIIGLTTHQRRLGAQWVQTGKLGLVMVRYNAAYRGAEQDIFPVADRLMIPIVAFTAQRWGALHKRTPDDPAGYRAPQAREWYRFALSHPSISVVLIPPQNRQELEEDLTLLEDWCAPTTDELANLTAHGERVRRHGGKFP